MSFKWIAIAVVALLAMPGGARAESTAGETPNPAKLCKELRAEQGRCAPLNRHVVRRMLQKAISECKAEREATQSQLPEGERGERNGEGRSAFRTCVKEKMRALLAELKAQHDAAVEQCKTERESDPVAFREQYGKGGRNRRAFQRCVVQHLRESSTL